MTELLLSGVRTAIGKYGGGLNDVPPCDLAATAVREAVTRSDVQPADVGQRDALGAFTRSQRQLANLSLRS